MVEILIPGVDASDVDADKHCAEFVPLKDGTKTGDKKYCDLSFACKQMGMLGEFVEITDSEGNVTLRDYLCTGKYARWEERSRDGKAT